jgi:hypothetical protein
MSQKLTLIIVASMLLGVVFSVNSVAWSFERQTPSRISEDQFVPPPFEDFEKSRTYCEILNDENNAAYYWENFDSGMGFAVYMNPAQCGPTPYPFKVTDVHLYLYEPSDTSYKWPAVIRVNIRASAQGDSCSGPQGVLYSEDFSVYSDSAFPSWMTLNLSTPCCVYEPFFLEVAYTEPRDEIHPHPSMLMDAMEPPPDTCDNWALFSDGFHYEWHDFWSPPTPGDAIIRATGYAGDAQCEDMWYWKADKPGQDFPAPSGMPDFDQYQFGRDSLALCGPTAVANCLWWFNAVPPETSPPGLIQLLSTYFRCDPIGVGTYVDSMQLGLDQYFIDYGFPLYEHTYYQPGFREMEDSLKKSQDIILLLGFWQLIEQQWLRIGGHYVTMAGVCSESLKVAFSDPARDWAVWNDWPGRIRPPEHPLPEYPPTVHNDPAYVSQDIYVSVTESPSPGNPFWGLPDYYAMVRKDGVAKFLGQNFQPWQEQFKGSYVPGVEVYTEVEYAVMICPGEWYWKPDKPSQTPFPAPSGMPDFDQNQDEWIAYCGPTAVANCLWWYNAVPPGMSPPGLIELLAGYFKTNPSVGTYVDSMQIGLDEYFSDLGFSLQESTFWEPDFHEMEDSLKNCQDIILLLGFWWYDGETWWREGGHFVTMAGVHSEAGKVAFSDPDNDGAVKGQRGRVRPPGHPPYPQYPPTQHNDPNYVSQDVYDCTLNPEFPSPGNPHWEIDDYITMIRDKHTGENVPQRFEAYSKPAPKDSPPITWHTEVEAAVVICPKPSAVEGEEGAVTPQDFELHQNYPNPFNNETVIKFSLSRPAEVNLAVYNILGQKVRTLVRSRTDAGPQGVKWDGKDEKGEDLSSGIYFCQLKVGEMKQTKRLVLLK